MECSHCRAENKPGSRFCASCGKALTSEGCAHCGAAVGPKDLYCNNCGANLHGALKPIRALARSSGTGTGAAGISAPRNEARSGDLSEGDIERRFLSVMFCDLADSTGLADRLDPEELREVIHTFRTSCAQVFEQFGGYVADYLGDGILIYFGYPQSHENDAERAVLAGLEVLSTISILNAALRPRGITLAVRIGIASGLVVAGDLIHRGVRDRHAIIGQTPNLAARLQSIAARDTIVIAQDTRALVRGLFELEELGPHVLKGFPREIQVWRVRSKRQAISRFQAMHEDGLSPLIGRREELTTLRDLWRRTTAGQGNVVILLGEPGIGKSRLVQELWNTLESDPEVATLLQYSAATYGRDSALLPFIVNLELALGFRSGDDPAEKRRKLTQYLAGLRYDNPEAPALLSTLLSIADVPRTLALSPHDQKERTLEVLVDLIVAHSASRPVLALFEDVHWFDPSSLDLILRIAEATRTLPVLLLITSRPDSAPSFKAGFEALRISLARLTPLEAEAMLDQIAEVKDLPRLLRSEILEKTDGVPLFIEELTKMVLETSTANAINRTDPQPDVLGTVQVASNGTAASIPATLLGSMTARLDGLGFAKEVAQVAAVIGREFSIELLHLVLDASEAEVEDAVAQLVAAAILQRKRGLTEATYVFRHALLQGAAYESLLIRRRQVLHRRIATILETQYPEIVERRPDALARHHAMGLNPESALRYWRLSGLKAASMSANLEAAAHFKKAIALLPNVSEDEHHDALDLELQSALSSAVMSSGGYATLDAISAQRRVAELCDKLGDGPHTFHAIFGQWLFYSGRSELARARGSARRLIRIAQAENDPSMHSLATHAWGMSAFSSGEFEQARTALLNAIALEAGPHPAWDADFQFRNRLPLALNYLSLSLFVLGYPDQAFSYLERISDSIGKARDTYIEVIALVNACYLHQFSHDISAVHDNAQRVLTLAEDRQFPVFEIIARIFRDWAASQRGETPDTDCILAGLRSMREFGAQEDLGYYHGLAAEILAPAGRSDQAIELLTHAIAEAEFSTERWYLAELYRLRAELRSQGKAKSREKPSGEVDSNSRLMMQDFETALAIARSQGAAAWELRAASSLCTAKGATAGDASTMDALESIYTRYTEGMSLPDLRAARQLLDQAGRTGVGMRA